MLEINQFVNYTDVVVKTFLFTSILIDVELSNKIWSLDIPDYGSSFGDLRYKLKVTDAATKKIILDILKLVPMDEIISEAIDSFSYEVNKMIKDEFIPMHNEVSQKSPFEVLIWLTKTDEFIGRDFIMEKNFKTSKIKPYNGLVCFVDTTCPNSYHGVSKLVSDTEIITIVGGLGRKDEYHTENK